MRKSIQSRNDSERVTTAEWTSWKLWAGVGFCGFVILVKTFPRLIRSSWDGGDQAARTYKASKELQGCGFWGHCNEKTELTQEDKTT